MRRPLMDPRPANRLSSRHYIRCAGEPSCTRITLSVSTSTSRPCRAFATSSAPGFTGGRLRLSRRSRPPLHHSATDPELRRHGIDRLDYILLTHIHIDHAGGAGALLAEFPEARVVCHPEGMRHLAAPEKLWQGSLQVLGKTAEAYGEIVAVPEERLFFAEEIPRASACAPSSPPATRRTTPVICFGDLLFAGEVAGVRSEVAEGIYMRPATPPRFLLPVALDSIDRMLALHPRRMVFAHYGLVENAMEHLQIGRRQLLLWVRGVAATAATAGRRTGGGLFRLAARTRPDLPQHPPAAAGPSCPRAGLFRQYPARHERVRRHPAGMRSGRRWQPAPRPRNILPHPRQLFRLVCALKVEIFCVTSSLPHCGQHTPPRPCSAMLRTMENS